MGLVVPQVLVFYYLFWTFPTRPNTQGLKNKSGPESEFFLRQISGNAAWRSEFSCDLQEPNTRHRGSPELQSEENTVQIILVTAFDITSVQTFNSPG